MGKTTKPWGGSWTEKKLEAFEKYVHAYLTIMNKNRDNFGWSLYYFDGFAGSGTRTAQEEAKEAEIASELFGNGIAPEELKVYQGAAERVVRIEETIRGFDHYCFVEKNKENCEALKAKLSIYQTVGRKYYIPMDANDAVKRFSMKLKSSSRHKALIFLDPFGMQIDWSSIESLKGTSVDLWVLVPTGVIINRLLERKYDPEKGFIHAEKLESFFGLTSKIIGDYFYNKTSIPTLFGDEETIVTKTEDAIHRIAELYIERLKEVFPYVTDEPLVLANNQHLPIYHLIFAAKNPTAMKIAQEIIIKQ